MEKFLVISEVSKKQGYIFKTNKLKENIGASTIIEYITEELPKEKLKKVLGKEDIKENVVNAGGGNSLFIVDSEKDAENFIKSTTREVLEKFPGVEFFMTYHGFDYEKDSIIDAIDKIYKKLNNKKSARTSVFRRKSYGIEQECVTTGLPAYKESEGVFLSRESYIKREWSKDEKLAKIGKESTIGNIIKDYENKGFIFTKELDNLITQKGENSYIAIISLDGNKMGQKIEKMKKNAKDNEDKNNLKKNNDEYIKKLYKFSNDIKQYYDEAFRCMLEKIVSSYDKIEDQLKLSDKNEEMGAKIMPVRPIILAGDDVCFVCNAKIALECVNLFITKLNKHSVEEEQLNACAGICMLRSTYPFDKGYEIAENLCKNGKAKIVDKNDASLVDFHVCQGEISTSLNEIRERVYMEKDSNINLNIKPLYLNTSDFENVFNSYENFKQGLEHIKKLSSESKGKVRKLRDIFPLGTEETRIFMNKNQIKKYFNKGFGLDNVEYGFAKVDGIDTCLYFDIIEVEDMFMSL